jgi:hypothetical protein
MMDNRTPKILMLALLLACRACAQDSAKGASAANRPLTTVLIVSGISRDPNDQATKAQAVSNLRECLLKRMGVDPRRLTILAADKPNASPASSLQPTASQIAQTVDALAASIHAEDRFIFYYIGQANTAGGELRLNLPGPDVTAQSLAERLKPIKAGTQLIVLDCPCAALAAKVLTGPNRIVVCASLATQPLGTRFSLHFVHALTQPQTDANNDGKVSLLESFAATAKEIEQWYRQRGILPTETPCLEDDGDGTPSERPWKYQTEGGDGLKASALLLMEGH